MTDATMSNPTTGRKLSDYIVSIDRTPPPAWALSYAKSVEYRKVREFLHKHLGDADLLQPLTNEEVYDLAKLFAATATIETVDAVAWLNAEARVYRAKYGYLDGSAFKPGTAHETVLLGSDGFRPAEDAGYTYTTAQVSTTHS